MPETLQLHPRHWAAVDPSRAAVIFGGSGEIVTYGALSERSNRCAQLLRRLGLRRGDHMAFLIENHPRFLEIAWAAHNSGLYFTPISWRFQVDEIAFILEDCGAQVVIVSAQQLTMLPELRRRLPDLRYLVIGAEADGCSSYERELASCPDQPIADETRGTDMVYSSGLDRPAERRQAELAETGIDGPSPMFAVYTRRYGWNPATVYLLPAPLYHSGPLRFAMTMQHVGATLVVMEHFEALPRWSSASVYRVTDAHFVPTMMVRAAEAARA